MATAEDIAKEVNKVRTDPKAYGQKVRSYMANFKGKVLRIPGSKAGIMTNEGAEAYKECAEFLEGHQPVKTLKVSKSLNNIALELFTKISQIDPSEVGSIDMEEIISKQGNFVGSFSRAIDFGGANAEQSIINLVVSDGDPNRGQRDTMFKEDVNLVGTATGKHKIYGNCTVIISCTKFTNKDGTDE